MLAFKIFLQSLIILGIINVWLLRFNTATAYRGGGAQNMKEEFANYGLAPWMMYCIGAAKVSLALLLFAGLWYKPLVMPCALIMAALMAGAVFMHFKVKDPIVRAFPSITMLIASLLVAFLPG